MNILHTSLRVAAAMLVAVTAIGPTSCNDDNKGPQVPTNTIYNVVTLASRTDKGVTFTYQANYDKPVYTYVASGYQLNEKKFDVGCRLLLAYVPQNGDALASGDITVWGVSPIFNGKLTYGNQEAYKNWGITELGVSALWMTEGWLNINAKFPTQGAPTNFQLVCDQATANGPDADVYMIFTPERPTWPCSRPMPPLTSRPCRPTPAWRTSWCTWPTSTAPTKSPSRSRRALGQVES